jgi:hypothetical protein
MHCMQNNEKTQIAGCNLGISVNGESEGEVKT